MDLTSKWEAAYEKFRGKTRTLANNAYKQMPGFSREDLEQELLLVLWECVKHYDPNKGARFNTFFQQSAKNRIITLIRHYSTKSRTALIVYLEEDAVRIAADSFLARSDVEDRVLNRIRLQEYVEKHGVGKIINLPEPDKRRRKAVQGG